MDALLPRSIQLDLVTPADQWLRSRETIVAAIAADGTTGDVTVRRDVFDPYEDETPAGYRPPADPRRWQAGPDVTAAAPIADAVAGMRGAIAGVDWTAVRRFPAHRSDAEYARLSLRFDTRPTGMDHLHPVQVHDGTWFVAVETSLDLFSSPQLSPVLDAARGVVELAQQVATPTDPAS